MTNDNKHMGGCLCGNIRFTVRGDGVFPHLCSCTQCQRWSGAPVVGWVDFQQETLAWDGPGGPPSFYRSSAGTRRGFCSECGGTLCAIDDGADTICMTSASFDDPSPFLPESHSFPESAPSWLAPFFQSRNPSTGG